MTETVKNARRLMAATSSNLGPPQARHWRSQSLEPRGQWSGTSRSACLMGWSCRTFREEPLARPEFADVVS